MFGWRDSGDTIFFALLLIAAGIPHGAADHLLFRRALVRRGENWGAVLPRFFLLYALLTGAYVLVWWFWPLGALILFLLLSAYHFGQTEYHAVRVGPWRRRLLFLLFGSFAIGFPVLWHLREAQPILNALLDNRVEISPAFARSTAWVLLALNALALFWLPAEKGKARLGRLLELSVLVVLFVSLPLLMGFAVFFLLWHSWPALVDQYRFLKKGREDWSWNDYLRGLLPLSLGAFVLLVPLLFLGPVRIDLASATAKIFLFISVITLPHALLVDFVYRVPHPAPTLQPQK